MSMLVLYKIAKGYNLILVDKEPDEIGPEVIMQQNK